MLPFVTQKPTYRWRTSHILKIPRTPRAKSINRKNFLNECIEKKVRLHNEQKLAFVAFQPWWNASGSGRHDDALRSCPRSKSRSSFVSRFRTSATNVYTTEDFLAWRPAFNDIIDGAGHEMSIVHRTWKINVSTRTNERSTLRRRVFLPGMRLTCRNLSSNEFLSRL